MIWLAVAVYSLIALVAARAFAGALAWSWAADSTLRRDGRPDGAQWFGATVLSLLAGCAWPLVLIVWKLPAPVIGAEREQKLREREHRIRELEREAGIR